MFKTYKKIFEKPGAKQFCIAAALARSPMSMQGFSIILMLSALYSQYALAGQVNAVSVLLFAIGTPVLARLVDKHGQSKVIRPAVIIYAISFTLLLIASVSKQSPYLLYGAAIFLGFFGGSFGAYSRARWNFVLDSATEKNTAYAVEAAIDELIFICGPILATFLIQNVHPAAGGIVCIICAFVGGLWLLSQKNTEPPVVVNNDEKKRPLIRNTSLISLCLIFVVCGFVFGVLDISVVAFSREIGEASWAGILLAFMAVGSLLSAVIYGARDWHVSSLRLFLLFITLMALSFSCFLWATTLFKMAFFMFLSGLTYSPGMTSAVNILREIVPSNRFTEGMAWFTTSWTIGSSIGTSIGGHVLDARGWYAGLVLTVILSWVMLVFVLAVAYPLRNGLRRARRTMGAQIDVALEQAHTSTEKFQQEKEVSAQAGVKSSKGYWTALVLTKLPSKLPSKLAFGVIKKHFRKNNVQKSQRINND